MKKVAKTLAVLLILVVLFGVLLATCRSYPKIESVPRGELGGAITLDQNWQPALRDEMNHVSFGSRLMPYDWFINLELANSDKRFIDPEHIERLGFIPLQKSKNNPDALPLGFAPDENDDGKWVGLTCVACHSSQVRYQGKRIHIDGAPGMMDFQAFEQSVFESLQALLNDEEKFEGFASRLKTSNKDELKVKVESRFQFMKRRLAINETEVSYGYGRLDAFGQIFNAVSTEALGLDENARSPDAPVSVPVLWDASHLDVVQWNASAPNTEPGPIGQNATTALAVYGTIDLNSDPFGLGYTSSVQVGNLGAIQANFYLLAAPKWPEDILGEIDTDLAEKGKEIYQKNCINCHALVDASDPKRKLKASLVPITTVGTDPVMAENFVNAKSKTGVLKGKKLLAGIAGEKFGDTSSTFDLVVHAASSAMAQKPVATIRSVLKEWQDQFKIELDSKAKNYKARPLNGLWASAPYLHNGSVPTVYDLLSPVEERPVEFFVGTLDFDPERFGILQGEGEYTSLFDTSLYGNTNVGHEFGVDLLHEEKMSLIEYLKTL